MTSVNVMVPEKNKSQRNPWGPLASLNETWPPKGKSADIALSSFIPGDSNGSSRLFALHGLWWPHLMERQFKKTFIESSLVNYVAFSSIKSSGDCPVL